MKPARAMGAGAYARAIERRWSELVDRPVVLSPKDWVLICNWHARGVPLQIVDEALQAAAERRKGGGGVRRLSYVAPAVEEGWRVVVEGRLSGGSGEARSDPATPAIESWRERMLAEPDDSPLHALLAKLVREYESGVPAERIERSLERELVRCVAPDRLSRCEKRVDAELAPFRERMDSQTRAATREHALISRLRRELSLARIARDRSDDEISYI